MNSDKEGWSALAPVISQFFRMDEEGQIMPHETSGGTESANSQPHLAAATEKESPALASRPNGVYNESMSEAIPSIPSRGQRNWGTIVAEWKWIAAMMSPFVMAIALYFIPATRGELETVRKDAASNLEIAKSNLAGQIAIINDKVDRVNEKSDKFISQNAEDHKIIASDLKEVAKSTARIEGFFTPRQPIPATTMPALPAPSPSAAPIDLPKPKSVKRQKPATVQAPSGIFGWMR